MSTTASDSRLGLWLSEVYEIVNDVKAIVSDADTAAQPASTWSDTWSDTWWTPTTTWWTPTTAWSTPTTTWWTPDATSSATGSLASSSLIASVTPAAQTVSQTTTASSSTLEAASGTPSVTSVQSSASAASSETPTSSSSAAVTSSGSSSIPNHAQASVTAAPASSSSAAVAKDHGPNILPIVLGTVFGVIGLALLAVIIWVWVKRRRSRRRQLSMMDDDDVASWHGPDGLSQRPMISAPMAQGPSSTSNNPPLMTQHPAYRDIVTGSTNPFVPPVPSPRRRSNVDDSPDLAKETMVGADQRAPSAGPPNELNNLGRSPVPPNQASSSPVHARPNPLLTGIAGLASGVAAHNIPRKPVSNQSSTTSSPTEAYAGFGWGYSTDTPTYGHARTTSSQPLISRDDQPGLNTKGEQGSSFGLMGFGKSGKQSVDAYSGRIDPQSPSSPTSPNRQSYESFTLRPTPDHTNPARPLAAAQTTPPRLGNTHHYRRVSFDEPVEGYMSPGAYRYGRRDSNDSNGTNGSGRNFSPTTTPNAEAIGYTDYAYPLPTTHSAGASPNQPSGAKSPPPPTSPTARPRNGRPPPDSGYGGGFGGYSYTATSLDMPSPPRQNRLRLRDILAQQKLDSERLRLRIPEREDEE